MRKGILDVSDKLNLEHFLDSTSSEKRERLSKASKSVYSSAGISSTGQKVVLSYRTFAGINGPHTAELKSIVTE